MENRITDGLNRRETSNKQHQDLRSSGSKTRIMHDSAKVDKVVTDDFHLLDLFCNPLVYQHTNLESF